MLVSFVRLFFFETDEITYPFCACVCVRVFRVCWKADRGRAREALHRWFLATRRAGALHGNIQCKPHSSCWFCFQLLLSCFSPRHAWFPFAWHGLTLSHRQAYGLSQSADTFFVPLSFAGNNNSNNNNNECISRARFHVKHAQLRRTGANTKIQNTCI